jgi:group I intron endonuclease
MNNDLTLWEERNSTEQMKNLQTNEKSVTEDSTSDTKTDSTKNDLNDTGKISGIYKIINKIDGKYYVGSSSNINRRRIRHFDTLRKGVHHNTKLQRAFDKHGTDNFQFVCVQLLSTGDLLTKEQLYLNECKMNPESNYNIKYVARAPKGYKHNEESKLKIRNSLKGRMRTDDVRRRISDGLKGKLKSPEHCRNLSTSHKGKPGRPHTEEHKRFVSKIHTGKIVLEETKKRIRDAWKIRKLVPISDETRKRKSEAAKGRLHSQETKEKIRRALIGNTNGKKQLKPS